MSSYFSFFVFKCHTWLILISLQFCDRLRPWWGGLMLWWRNRGWGGRGPEKTQCDRDGQSTETAGMRFLNSLCLVKKDDRREEKKKGRTGVNRKLPHNCPKPQRHFEGLHLEASESFGLILITSPSHDWWKVKSAFNGPWAHTQRPMLHHTLKHTAPLNWPQFMMSQRSHSTSTMFSAHHQKEIKCHFYINRIPHWLYGGLFCT